MKLAGTDRPLVQGRLGRGHQHHSDAVVVNEFVHDIQKGKQWQGFLRKNALEPMQLTTVVADLRDFLLPVLVSVAMSRSHDLVWRAGDGWEDTERSS